MNPLYRFADQCDEAADLLGAAARRVSRIDPPPAVCGVDAPGRLADLTSALREQWLTATTARQQEASCGAARLADLAAALRVAATGYAEADAAAGRRTAPEE